MTTTATDPTRLSLTVDRFLDAIGGGGGIPAHLLAVDIILDATVPGWRFNVRGSEAVARFDEDGCIAQDRFICGGRWDAARLAEMAAAEHAG